MRRKLVVANWKMYGSLMQCREAVPTLAKAVDPAVELVLCPPAPYLGTASDLASASALHIGAQDVAAQKEGAFTGEWAAPMLADVGCRYAIVGHSERRQRHAESDADVVAKAGSCVEAGIIPIVCIGETEQERLAGQTEAVLARQLGPLLEARGRADFVLAYEPVWAIGTGRSATPEMAQEVHAFLRQRLAQVDAALAEKVPLLYGGSVKPDNSAALFAMPDIDGGLIGSASLQTESLLAIYRAMQ
ncbi:MAG: triose-phosphate isomerase [Pseudogulbenkiania sp.]|nr:triose-phosphate isomerase [Pseudogulbenkiania sp.]